MRWLRQIWLTCNFWRTWSAIAVPWDYRPQLASCLLSLLIFHPVIQNVADPRRNGRIGKVLSWPNRVFGAIWNAISVFKRFFPIATETVFWITDSTHIETLMLIDWQSEQHLWLSVCVIYYMMCIPQPHVLRVFCLMLLVFTNVRIFAF